MERLTSRSETGPLPVLVRGKALGPAYFASKYEYEDYRDAIARLADYEDAEEQGRMVVLPCKVGDTVYAITRKVISEFLIEHLEIYDSGIFVSWRCVKGFYGGFRIDGFPAKEIGETVFLTREAAEEALQKTLDTSRRI